jgi:hypothetical protein
LKREISNKTAAMVVELARRFALESSFQTRLKKKTIPFLKKGCTRIKSAAGFGA